MVTGRPMFPGSTVKEELHLIFRLLGECSAALPNPHARAVADCKSGDKAQPQEPGGSPGKALQRRGQGGQKLPAAPLQACGAVRARSSSSAAPWDAQTSRSLLGERVPSLLALARVRLISLQRTSTTSFPLSPSQEPRQKTPGLE